MVSDNRPANGMRQCPTIEDEETRPLVAQQISAEKCHSRQEKGYHKCYRCSCYESIRVIRQLVPIRMN